ncbi:MAG: polyprenyl synthetase family protein [Cytophagaceae bacterium]|jgi:octaprenyl-diphosphate synthase|nr:polyprenyl synthetase family protein [Cytophagaceae bacterium]
MAQRSLDDIKSIIDQEMSEFEIKFRQSMKSNVMLLDTIMNYIVKRKGKQMRPMFVFLSAHLAGPVNESTYRGAALIELLHTATLVHDDVVDDSNYRRGLFSINALWKNKIAVLVGDYLLSRGLLLSIDHADFHLLKIVSQAVREMSEGELLQIEKARHLNITEEVYYTIIRQKTASLIASCCSVGVASVTSDANLIEKARLFGEKVGLAFQVKDDLFDYETAEVIGKPVGIDIKEKKLTLPLIFALQKAGWWESKKIRFIIKHQTHKTAKVKEVLDFVRASGGIEYARAAMNRLSNEAVELLTDFPDSPYKQSLLDLVDYTIRRKH